jgi:precorrin-6B methylase 1
MSYILTDFLISLADINNLKKYHDDPEHYMTLVGLTEDQKKAVRAGDLYRIRRYSAREMFKESLHARLLTRIFEEKDPEFKFKMDRAEKLKIEIPFDVDTDHEVETDHDIVQTHDLGDDIAEFSSKYSSTNYYDHLFDDDWVPTKTNELVFVGTGINGANHLSAEAEAYIAAASKVLYCVADLAIERKIMQLNDSAEDLYIFYGDDKPRRKTYEEMVERILEVLEDNPLVCVVFYGHPGIFVWPSFKGIQLAHKMGYKAYMLPAISSLDCLFADIGFDPSRYGCQIVEATDLLVRSRKPDIHSAVVIFQVGCVGDLGYNSRGYDRRNLPVLAEYLISFYGEDYEVILYEAAQYPICEAKARKIQMKDFGTFKTTGLTTMYIPPKSLPPRNEEMIKRLGLEVPKFD